MSWQRYQRGVRALGGYAGGTSRLARPPSVLPEPDVRPHGAEGILYGVVDNGEIWVAQIEGSVGLAWSLLTSGLQDSINNYWFPTDGVVSDAKMYVGFSSFGQGRIVVLDAATGSTIDTWFVDELVDPETVVMGPDGMLYIADRLYAADPTIDGPIYRTSVTSPSLELWANSGSGAHWAPVFVGDRLFINDNWSTYLLEVSPTSVTAHDAGVEVGGLCTDGSYVYFASGFPVNAVRRFDPSDNSFSLVIDLEDAFGDVSVGDDIAFAADRLYTGVADSLAFVSIVSCMTDGSDARDEGVFPTYMPQGLVAG